MLSEFLAGTMREKVCFDTQGLGWNMFSPVRVGRFPSASLHGGRAGHGFSKQFLAMMRKPLLVGRLIFCGQQQGRGLTLLCFSASLQDAPTTG